MNEKELLNIIKTYKEGQAKAFFEKYADLDMSEFTEIDIYVYEHYNEEFTHFVSLEQVNFIGEAFEILWNFQKEKGGSWRLDLSNPSSDVWNWVEVNDIFLDYDL